MSIHIRLKKARVAAKLTQDEVAKKFGITRTAVSLWESSGDKGTKPDIRKLQELATLYETPIEALLEGDVAAQEKNKASSAAVEYLALTKEQRQILSLVESIEPETRKAWLKVGASLPKLGKPAGNEHESHADNANETEKSQPIELKKPERRTGPGKGPKARAQRYGMGETIRSGDLLPDDYFTGKRKKDGNSI